MASTDDETYRSTLVAHTPDGETTTLIVTRQGRGHAGRVWLTLLGSIRTTIELTDHGTVELTGLLHAASLRTGPPRIPSTAAIDAAARVITDGEVLRRALQTAYDIDRGAA